MPCGVHFAYYPNCRPCRDAEDRADAEARHKQTLRQSERQHRDHLKAHANWAGRTARVATGAGAGFSFGGIVLAVLVIVPIVAIAVIVTVVGAIFSAAAFAVTLALQGVVAAAVVGAAAAAITYVVKRSKVPDARFAAQWPPSTELPIKERMLSLYRSLDPVSRATVKVGAISAAAGFVLSVLF